MTKGYTEGPFGFPMKSEVAKAVEAVVAGLNADCKSFLAKEPGGIARRSAEVRQLVPQEGEGTEVSTINTASLDRDNEVVRPRGGNWSGFEKGGGPVTWCHMYTLPTVARCLWMQRTWDNRRVPQAAVLYEQGDAWMAKSLYHPRPGTDVLPEGQSWPPAVVHYLVTQCEMRGKSIGFIPTDLGRPTKEEIAAIPALEKADCFIREWMGLEYAVAPVQSNPDAVRGDAVKAKSAGFPMPKWMLDTFGFVLPGMGDDVQSGGDWLEAGKAVDEPRVTTRAEVREMVRKRVEGIGLGQIVKDALDLRRGRV